MRFPLLSCSGTVTRGGSKSILQRLMLVASLQREEVHCFPGSECEDVQEMAMALSAVGVRTELSLHSLHVIPEIDKQEGSVVTFSASATAFRLWLARAVVSKDITRIRLGKALAGRPWQPFIQQLQSLGCEVKVNSNDEQDYPILMEIQAPEILPESIEVDGSISSQFISGMLLVSPFLPKGLHLIWRERPASFAYIQLTLALMKEWGIRYTLTNDGCNIPAGQRYVIAKQLYIEPDISSAAFFWAMGALSHGGVGVIVGSKASRYQPDWIILDILRQMGAVIEEKETGIRVTAGELHGISCNLEDTPDLFPLIAVLAVLADTPSVISGTSRLQYKESDRLQGVTKALGKLGVEYEKQADSIIIHPLQNAPSAVCLDTQHDHRLVMAFTLLKQVFPHIRLSEYVSVSKSCPEFIQQLSQICHRRA